MSHTRWRDECDFRSVGVEVHRDGGLACISGDLEAHVLAVDLAELLELVVAERHLEVLDSCCWKVCVRCVRVVQNEFNWEGPGSFPFLKWKFQGPSWGVEFCGIVSSASYAEFVKCAAVHAWDPRSIHLRGPVCAASGVSTQSVVHPIERVWRPYPLGAQVCSSLLKNATGLARSHLWTLGGKII